MKSTLFTKVLETETVEIDASVNDAISRFCQLQSPCKTIPPYRFSCNNKGAFKVYYFHFWQRIISRMFIFKVPTYYIKGTLKQNGAKTEAEINYVRGLLPILYFILRALGGLFLLAMSLLAPFIEGNPTLLILIPVSLIYLFFLIHDYAKRNNAENSDYEKLKQEVLDRIEMVNKWDK